MNETTATILVIDDEVSVRESLADHLSDRGYRVLTADNGRVGLDLFESELPDLVLTDLRMPEVDGLAVLRRIAEISPDAPLIIISGTGHIGDSVQALRLGAWDYILKPVEDMAIITHAVDNALERSRLRHENAAQRIKLEQALKQVHEDEEAGRKVQMKLLPPTPFRAGPYTLTQCVVPSMWLSGDFVGYFEVNEDEVSFYAADVSGHGISSALVTVLLRSFMRKQLEKFKNQGDETLLHPGQLLSRLNGELLEQNLNKHITMFYGVLSKERNTLSYSNGGQFPLPILFSDAKAEVLSEKGIAVGLFPDPPYETVTRSLPEEFLLTVYSDGILEVLPSDTMEGKLAFLEALDSPEEIREFLTQLESIPELPDDVAVLTVKKEVDV